ncbi:aldehyde dehydrogenase family protein [Microbulbifer magnicolonia]|uniref:aldehyde dehydrogenase family protein n=1 Tax=Microbulbifer magnicolonia TaxID=3109744 RepID=UPI002B4181DA|nr:aldehyde dehydrogenase family protein [Microbulbifer sp. GG15]
MQMYIDGRWCDAADGETLAVINPATEEMLDTVPNATIADIELAVASSKRAFAGWRKLPARERCDHLKQMSQKLEASREEFEQLLTHEQGKALAEHREELDICLNTIDYYAQLIRNGIGKVIPPDNETAFNFVMREPYGPTACIIPFNYPLLLLFWKIAPALAAGNTVIVKPSEKTPLATLKLAEQVLAHFPPGVINIVTGCGNKIGDALTTHPDVPTIAFTGSTAVGQHIIRATAHQVKNLHLELGGKDAAVIAEDMDPALAARAIATSSMWNAGQICTSTERVFVAESIYPRFLEELTAVVSALRLGDGLDPDTDIGPMCDASGFAKVERHIADARAKGARILSGGQRSARHARGYFFEPTIIADARPDMLCMQEETFGPTVAVAPYQTIEQAIELVNGTAYGLGAVFMGHNPQQIRQFFLDVKAGTVWINDPLPDNVAGPFGGMKHSGSHSRELGEEGLFSFMETKHVHWDFDPAARAVNWFDKP